MAPPYYSQHAVFASVSDFFIISASEVMRLLYAFICLSAEYSKSCWRILIKCFGWVGSDWQRVRVIRLWQITIRIQDFPMNFYHCAAVKLFKFLLLKTRQVAAKFW